MTSLARVAELIVTDQELHPSCLTQGSNTVMLGRQGTESSLYDHAGKDSKAQAQKALKATKKGTWKKHRKPRFNVTFHRPKTRKHDREPKYPRSRSDEGPFHRSTLPFQDLMSLTGQAPVVWHVIHQLNAVKTQMRCALSCMHLGCDGRRCTSCCNCALQARCARGPVSNVQARWSLLCFLQTITESYWLAVRQRLSA